MRNTRRQSQSCCRIFFLPAFAAARRASACSLFGLACLAGLRGDAQPLARLVNVEGRPEAPKIRFVKDPVDKEIQTFRHDVRQLYNTSRFDELEKIATELRGAKAKVANGSWKIVRYYDSLECRKEEPESMWQLHDRIHRDWIAQKPVSVTAKLAYADFFCSYAWHARGNGYADSVTPEGWKLFRERLESAQKIVDEVRKMKDKDPYWGTVALRIALGLGMDKKAYDALVAEAHAAEPLYWGYFVGRAYSLLPRWHGEPGDWEAFALKAAALPDGLGAELYARIILHQMDFYRNVFDETDASWPKAREGLELMLKRYPDSLEVANQAALLAFLARDREMFKAMLTRIDYVGVSSVWDGPEQFYGALKWVQKAQEGGAGH